MSLTLRRLKALHPAAFHFQTWYEAEPFFDTPLPPGTVRTPPTSLLTGVDPERWPDLPLAVQLAQAFLDYPSDLIWTRYLWCADQDRQGQRIYVGGATADNGRRFEIHRHLALNERWGVPLWPERER